MRLSINPTYDSRTDGLGYTVATLVNGRLICVKDIADPFVRTSVKVSLFDCIKTFFQPTIEIRINARLNHLEEDILELDHNYKGSYDSTRKREFDLAIENSLRSFGDAP